MKSRFPEYSVAITGLSKYIASASVRPKTSERRSET